MSLEFTSVTRFNYRFYIFISLIVFLAASMSSYAQRLNVQSLGAYQSSEPCGSAAKIVDYNPANGHLVLVNDAVARIEVVDISNPAVPLQVLDIDYVQFGSYVQSIAVSEELIAAAIESSVDDTSGVIVFFDAQGQFLNKIYTETTPDLMSFTADGQAVVTAHRHQNSRGESGSVTVVNIEDGVVQLEQKDIRRADFAEFKTSTDEAVVSGMEGEAGMSIQSTPDYLAVDKDSRTGYVTLRDADKTEVIDINLDTVAELLGGPDSETEAGGVEHGLEDFLSSLSAESEEREASVYDDVHRLDEAPGYFEQEAEMLSEAGLAMIPVEEQLNAVGRYRSGGVEYLVTANRGEAASGTFSIWDLQGNLVFDSSVGPYLIDEVMASEADLLTESAEVRRSTMKLPMTTGRIGNRTYLFTGLTAESGVLVYDITEPATTSFLDYLPLYKDLEVNETAEEAEVFAEGLFFIRKSMSPTHQPMLVVASADGGTTSFFEIRENTVAELDDVELPFDISSLLQ